MSNDILTVLDVGCGVGEFMWALKDKGYTVEGCDIDEIYIKKSQKIVDEVKYANVEKLSKYYSPNSFDMISCLHVLEHCSSPYKALIELKKVTRKYILLAVPNARYIANMEIDAHLFSWNEATFARAHAFRFPDFNTI